MKPIQIQNLKSTMRYAINTLDMYNTILDEIKTNTIKNVYSCLWTHIINNNIRVDLNITL